jgi:two-component system nitrate/nitrite response regulator NarL
MLEQGMANKIIAYRLSLSQSTVKAHVHSIISKLNVRNRTEAAVTSQHHAESIQTRGGRGSNSGYT